ncbi:MAG: hypothetical protein CMH20_01085 [Methylophaga sp.]|jgi:hypothetical protein|nr:hypothetical protein [Methylophaga sp.]|tara:strand:+ start:5703 stop:5921 length:219 start_codon:yes stop_codon:yes gene_type:complete
MHYIAAADMIREGTEGQDRELVAEYFSQFFANDNYRFDRSRFMEGCGIKETVLLGGRVHREVTKTKRTAYGV